MHKILQESEVCISPDGRPVLTAELYSGRTGGWELEVTDVVGRGRSLTGYADELAARRAMTEAYARGRVHGTWRVTPSMSESGSF
jgi:hypothetical protein